MLSKINEVVIRVNEKLTFCIVYCSEVIGARNVETILTCKLKVAHEWTNEKERSSRNCNSIDFYLRMKLWNWREINKSRETKYDNEIEIETENKKTKI